MLFELAYTRGSWLDPEGFVIVCYPSGVRSGPRYAGPYYNGIVVPWPKRPTAAQWEAARDALVAQLAPVVFAGAIAEALEAIGC